MHNVQKFLVFTLRTAKISLKINKLITIAHKSVATTFHGIMNYILSQFIFLLNSLLYSHNLIAYRRRFGGFVKLIGIMREPETISYTFRILMRRVSFIGDDHRNNDGTIVSHNTHN